MPAKKGRKPAKAAKKSTTRKPAAKKAAAKKPAKRAPAKKAAAKKSTAKRPAVKKATAAASSKKMSAVKKAMTKTQIMTQIAEITDLSKKDVAAVFECLSDVIHNHLSKKAVGEFTLPGLLKCRVIHKPATKARKGINHLTGEETVFKAKPARNVVRIRPLKKLKEMAAK